MFHRLLGEMGGADYDGSVRPRARGSTRDEKVARFKAQQKCAEEIKIITGKLQRRGRMDVPPEDVFEGGDAESLIRSLATQQLKKCATQCIDELISMNQEVRHDAWLAKWAVARGQCESKNSFSLPFALRPHSSKCSK